jgi:hypothetical protein
MPFFGPFYHYKATEYPLDAIDNLYGVYSTKLVTSQGIGSPLVRLRRLSDDVEADFYAGAGSWLSAGDITTWLAGSTAYVCRVYDQVNTAGDFIQWTAASQPLIDLSGAHPSISFDKSLATQRLFNSTALDFARNRTACSLIAVRKHNSAAAGTSQQILHVSTGTSSLNARCALQISSAGVFQANGRRLDSDGSDGTTGISEDTAWAVHIGRFDWANADCYQALDGVSESDTSFQTAGSTSDTDSQTVIIGSGGDNTRFFDGELTLAVLVRDLLTDEETTTLLTSLARLKL